MIGGLEKKQINLIHQNTTKPAEWKHYVEWRFRPLGLSKKWSRSFHWTSWHIPPNNKIHGRSVRERITFLDTVAFKGERFIEKSILDIKTHYKLTETSQYTHFSSCHPPRVKSGFIKGEAVRLLRTNSLKTTFEECLANFKWRFEARGYLKKYIERSLSEVTFDSRQSALKAAKTRNGRDFWLLSLHCTNPGCSNET